MAKYKGRTVKLNKPTRGDVKKSKVFVRDRTSIGNGRIKTSTMNKHKKRSYKKYKGQGK